MNLVKTFQSIPKMEYDDFSNGDGYAADDLSGNFPERFLCNTGYYLSELIAKGHIKGEAIDHGEVSCKCSCDHPIRYEHQLVMEGKSFPIGSTCVKMWTKRNGKISCKDCEKLFLLDDLLHSADDEYRCFPCREKWDQSKRDERKRIAHLEKIRMVKISVNLYPYPAVREWIKNTYNAKYKPDEKAWYVQNQYVSNIMDKLKNEKKSF